MFKQTLFHVPASRRRYALPQPEREWKGYEQLRLVFVFLFLLLSQRLTTAHTLTVNVQDKASLQRGAMLFMNYCSGCHSLKYLRYSRMAEGLGLTSFDGQMDEGLLKNNLIFTQAAIGDPIRIAMPAEDAKQWFGIVPPDLSLIARERGTDWLFTYLNSFYSDDSRPFGTNNRLVPYVAMPNILESLTDGLTHSQYESSLQDLVTFLAYVGEPEQAVRYHLGLFVVSFLGLFLLVALGLNFFYWRKIN